jgi:NAD(P)-dependent dehydrogenase (short-subunit alcohol dehydrogenase family)
MNKIAVITGSGRGIGFEIGKQLLSMNFEVIFTMRNMATGRPIVNELRKEYKNAWFHQMDVTEEGSIADAVSYITGDFNQVDVLVNNAGILIEQNDKSTQVSLPDIRKTMETNVYGPMMVTRAMIPLLSKSDDARVINLSSSMGQLSGMGGGSAAYRISKAALNALTLIQSHELAGDGIKVNSVDPGWVKTDMGGPGAERPVDKGAETAVWLATESKIPNGKFIRDKKVIDW